MLLLCLLTANAAAAIAPVSINLDPLDKAGNAPDYAAAYTEGGPPTPVAAPEASVKEPAGEGIARITIVITNPAPGDFLTADTAGTAILALFEDGALALAGPDSAAAFQDVLRTVVFASDSRNPAQGIRTLRVDASPEAETVFTEITVIPINDAPVHATPGPQITPRNVPLIFSRGRGNAITVGDLDAGAFPIRTVLSVPRGVLVPSAAGDVIMEKTYAPAFRLVLSGALAAINDALEGLRFEPPDGWHGQLTLLVETDDQGHTGLPGPLTARSTIGIAVAVIGQNQPPEAHAGGDQSAYEYTAVSLDGTRSTDPDGSEIAYDWRQASGPPVVLSDAGEALPFFTAPATTAAGDTLMFQLTVTDNQGAQAVDFTTVTIEPLDGPFMEIMEGRTATLSFSPTEGGLTNHFWRQIAGPTAPLSDEASPAPSFVGPIVNPDGAVLVFEGTAATGSGETVRTMTPVAVSDNGIAGFPPEVLTFRTVRGAPMGIRVISGALVALHPVDPDHLAELNHRPEDLPYGLIEMAINTAMPGDSVVARIYFPEPAGGEYRWFKYLPGNEWRDAGNHAVFAADRTWLTFKLVDGGIWDDDGAVDGRITDPSGLGKPSSEAPPENGNGSGDGDSGSCFLRALLP